MKRPFLRFPKLSNRDGTPEEVPPAPRLTYLSVDACEFVIPTRELYVCGWAYVEGIPALETRITVLALSFTAISGLERLDVAAHLDDTVPIRTGFELIETIADNLTDWPVQLHGHEALIEIFAGDTPINLTRVPIKIRRNIPLERSYQGNVDICEYDITSHKISVHGWCHFFKDQVKSVEISFAELRFLAHTHLDRHDVIMGSQAAMPYGTGYELSEILPDNTLILDSKSKTVTVTILGFGGSVVTFDVPLSPSEKARKGNQHALGVSESKWANVSLSEVLVALGQEKDMSQSPKELLVFTNSLALGGGQTYVYELIKLLITEERIKFPILVKSEIGGPMQARLANIGVSSEPLNRVVLSDNADLLSWIRVLRLDISVHSPKQILLNTLSMWPVALAALSLGIVPIWAIHESYSVEQFIDMTMPNFKEHRSAANLIKDSLQKSKLMFEAEATARIVLGKDWGRHQHLNITGYYITEIDDALRTELSFSKIQRAQILSVGTMERRKNQLAALTLAKRLRSSGENIELVLIGAISGEPYTQAVKKEVELLDIGNFIRIEEATTELDKWYQSASVYLSTSAVESLPITVLLAMAHGVPCVVPRIFGLGELIEDGVSGFLYEPLDLGAAYDALKVALSLNEDQRAQIARAARAAVEQFMNKEALISQFD